MGDVTALNQPLLSESNLKLSGLNQGLKHRLGKHTATFFEIRLLKGKETVRKRTKGSVHKQDCRNKLCGRK